MDLWLLQCQSALARVRVTLQNKHGHHSFCRHDNHIWVGQRAVHYGRAQVHGDEVQLGH